MDPRTGTFHPDDDASPLPVEWPRFEIGEEVQVKGFTFIVQRINRSTMVLRPKPTGGVEVARNLMRKLAGDTFV